MGRWTGWDLDPSKCEDLQNLRLAETPEVGSRIFVPAFHGKKDQTAGGLTEFGPPS